MPEQIDCVHCTMFAHEMKKEMFEKSKPLFFCEATASETITRTILHFRSEF